MMAGGSNAAVETPLITALWKTREASVPSRSGHPAAGFPIFHLTHPSQMDKGSKFVPTGLPHSSNLKTPGILVE